MGPANNFVLTCNVLTIQTESEVKIRSCSQVVDRVTLDGRPELVAVHTQSDDGIVHDDGLRETHGFAGSALDPRPQREGFAFDLLAVGFATGMRSRGQGPFIDPSSIRVAVLQATGLQELLQLDKDCIRTTPEGIRENSPTQMLKRLPQPALVRFAADNTPPLIHLRGLHAPDFDRDRLRTTPRHDAGVDLGQPGGVFLLPASPSWAQRAEHGQYHGSHSP